VTWQLTPKGWWSIAISEVSRMESHLAGTGSGIATVCAAAMPGNRLHPNGRGGVPKGA
jgi:hypothetical protein